ncbi:hypothetical protein LTR10_016431 [Elasticomyces elasticus]|uniref:Phosphatidate phosphatase APP1 catalytic domain-containing protein n=1 Tax=Exophiala sideris TaxID=1016849 RepID=A0ABR0JBV1_9EURO|nr:hypothetical protein LTR10_016431 [Elasticomyces elasticus]KAK5031181.1 hypothetical protein LTS07_004916 [Exophiala sideris]KAK5038902.1 hypothetical protein LTR13_003933 [Exophiala sideris]KAK5060786.1 hypothetical protein LTR69_005385 [Exophiala sideris]KAK5183698.1 hypothetical protein LTR44_003980 [Eurotiomycetes sp. CCFEE 6388]
MAANFADVEAKLPQRYTKVEMTFIDKKSSRRDLTEYVSNIADLIGLDGKPGSDPEARRRIKERLKPFVMATAPRRTMVIQGEPNLMPIDSLRKLYLGPSNRSGISSQLMLTGGSDNAAGKTVVYTSDENLYPDLRSKTRFIGPEGWAIISDIDDTIKITQTTNPIGILQSTFADVPRTTTSMPGFYKLLDDTFRSPAWFYLSASPYNLYPFLHDFIKKNYPPGTIILRDASWMNFAGLLQSFTQGVQEYKTNRIEKIQSWLPKRKFICIGDSTQSDPEAYAQMYTKYPGWIKAIYIRKVTDTPNMANKNRNQRFTDAFKNVPDHVWRVFVQPEELTDHVEHVSGQAHAGVPSNLLGL